MGTQPQDRTVLHLLVGQRPSPDGKLGALRAFWLRAFGVEPKCLQVMGLECKPFHSPAIKSRYSMRESNSPFKIENLATLPLVEWSVHPEGFEPCALSFRRRQVLLELMRLETQSRVELDRTRLQLVMTTGSSGQPPVSHVIGRGLKPRPIYETDLSVARHVLSASS